MKLNLFWRQRGAPACFPLVLSPLVLFLLVLSLSWGDLPARSFVPNMESPGELRITRGELRNTRGELRITRGELRIMWYNVENLFHPQNDSIPGDDEFTPEGVRHWSYSRYGKKLTALAKVIVAAGSWEPPDLVGMCEVEEAQVLEDLVNHPILKPYEYSYLHLDSPDRRGMDVACLYREHKLRLVDWEVFPPEPDFKQGPTRDMMHICCVWGKNDTLDLFLVHLISKYRGAGATAESRKLQAAQLVSLVDSVHGRRPHGLTVMCGDFNDAHEGYSMEPLRKAQIAGDSIRSIALEGGPGSYKYRGRWSCIDRFLICGKADLFGVTGSIVQLSLLMTTDEPFGGVKPKRCYEGYFYRGGISDHLPIVLDISRRPFPSERLLPSERPFPSER